MYTVSVVDDIAVIDGHCIVTGKPHQVKVPAKGFNNWRKGMNIYHAMPEVSADDREFLISSTSPEGWDLLFGVDECIS